MSHVIIPMSIIVPFIIIMIITYRLFRGPSYEKYSLEELKTEERKLIDYLQYHRVGVMNNRWYGEYKICAGEIAITKEWRLARVRELIKQKSATPNKKEE